MTTEVGLPDALERAASALERDADAIRPANGDPWQLAAQLDDAAAVRVLSWLLCHEPSAGEELAAAWAEDPEGAGGALLAIEADTLPKPARKLLRRVLHRLRSRGVDVPTAADRGALVAKLPALDESLNEGRLSALDPRGSRVVYLALDHPSGGARLFQIGLDEAQGLLDFEIYNTGRSRLRRFLREFERAGRLPAAAAPIASLRALVARAAAAHPDARPLPRGFSEWRSRLCETDPSVSTPGELAREALAELEVPERALERVCGWVREGMLGPWPPTPEGLVPIAERIAESGKSVLVVSGATRQQQVERALEEAAAEIFDAGFSECTARRCDETAYLLWKAERPDDARAVLAAADAFRGPEPAANPVARELLEVLFAPVLRAARGDATDEGGEGSSSPPGS